MRLTRQQIRKNRWWKHILFHLPSRIFGPDLREIHGYDPEPWREAFERFQARGRSVLSKEEISGIHPLISAQKCKEILLTSLADECFEWWSNGWGWMGPLDDTLYRKDDAPLDRLTRVAILRMKRTMLETAASTSIVDFFSRHPGISESKKQKRFGMVAA